ncbi:DUF4145 domain-containing protein [Aliivibrio fischeri]|uniref:DUF4145 domain-containing protein n=1 Tax=Aliivibrio fischeri TaxID=668 RepID=A0A6N3YYV4_ALIFS|nr:DUF4145 domain-containing protein [Aliivibrio fischeri]MUK45866.1 DUF4145 domain-containing protein [Aliivibrio fischeri]MUK82927.1 DUF4145 domain-containing protein [Aliivibrio fischeri]MUK86736.1 DUF4145 domain-containing protein [Aliivibrio fischeri]
MAYESPELEKAAFTCPFCNAFSAMSWNQLQTRYDSKHLDLAKCHCCSKESVWLNGLDSYPVKMIYPEITNAPLPNDDLPNDCKKDYMEARSIANNSPKGAAALLRLCIQRLVVHLGGNGKNINNDIGDLVKNGLSSKIQQALDIVRVIGNNAVHPGEMSLDDNKETVTALFNLINLIVDNQITQPKQVSELFSILPEGARNAVEKRDSKA